MTEYQNLIFSSEESFLTAGGHRKQNVSALLEDWSRSQQLFLWTADNIKPLQAAGLSPYFKDISFCTWHNAEAVAALVKQYSLDPEKSLVISSDLQKKLTLAQELKFKTVWLSKKKNIIGYQPTMHLKRLADLSFYIVN